MPKTQGLLKKIFIFLAISLVTALITIILGEFIIGIINPQKTLRPRAEFSSEYGFKNYKNTTRVHERRGLWRFEYTANEYGNRGEAVPISNYYAIPNLIVLGDSNSLGIGVNDGEEYPTVMANALAGKYAVSNLAIGGWGLTQQIRRFYEFGQLYAPEIVLLQHTHNDLADNFNYRVTILEDGNFKFVDSKNTTQWVKKLLSKSFIQKSQIYNLVRHSLYLIFTQRHIDQVEKDLSEEAEAGEVPIREQYYIDLLEVFVADLNARGTHLLFIAANGELEHAPYVKKKVLELETQGSLDYIEVVDYLDGVTDYGSDEGHIWGAKAHKILGEELAKEVLKIDANKKDHADSAGK